MSFASIRQQVGTLERTEAFPPICECPFFTPSEIEAVARRAEVGERFNLDELRRLERHSPIIEGELLISAYRGSVFVKRYPGVDLAEV